MGENPILNFGKWVNKVYSLQFLKKLYIYMYKILSLARNYYRNNKYEFLFCVYFYEDSANLKVRVGLFLRGFFLERDIITRRPIMPEIFSIKIGKNS